MINTACVSHKCEAISVTVVASLTHIRPVESVVVVGSVDTALASQRLLTRARDRGWRATIAGYGWNGVWCVVK